MTGSATGTSGTLTLDTGASTGSVSATPGQIQVGAANAGSITIGHGLPNVGIGQTNSSVNGDALQINSTNDWSDMELTFTNASDGYASVDFFDKGTSLYDFSLGTLSPNYNDGTITGPKFFVQHFYGTSSWTYPLVIDGAGHVGVGQVSPSALLDLSAPPTGLAGTPSGTVGSILNIGPITFSDTSAGGTSSALLNAIQAPTLAASSASTTVNAYTLSISGAPVAGGSKTLTNSTALNVALNTLASTTNGYGLQVNAPAGATNNYAGAFLGGNLGVGTAIPQGALDVRQAANSLPTIYSRRATDTSPTGFWLQLQNNAGTGSVLAIDVNGIMSSTNFAGIPIVGGETTAPSGTSTVTFSTTSGTVQRLRVTTAVTSWSVNSGVAGQRMCLFIIEDGTGHPFAAAPSNVLGYTPINTVASSRNSQCFFWDTPLSAWIAESVGTNF